MNSYFLQSALLPDGWQRNVRVTVNNGVFHSIEPNATQQTQDQNLEHVIPSMPNAHSHVFQRAMAGMSEYKSGDQDSFWSWRDLMYRLANEIDAERLYQIAVNCYTEMLAAGYASVCEFHYVHRSHLNVDDFYSHSEVLLKAASDVGLPITLLPVLYAFAGVGDEPLKAEQERFKLSTNEYIALFRHLESKLSSNQKLGICFHSIRAVNKNQMKAVLEALPKDVPVHIHIAEQQIEVDQAVAYLGQRPVAWLFDHFAVDGRWSLVHATHLNDHEIKLIADSGAVAVLCPLTEANLGDGIFPMPQFMSKQGNWAIGSDSHVEIKPQQEIKMLEYSQRLANQQRNVCCDSVQAHVGTWTWLRAAQGGRQASGLNTSEIAVGCIAQIIELSPQIQTRTAEQVLDDWIFSDRTVAEAKIL